jgi:protein-tyrosine phosphatase
MDKGVGCNPFDRECEPRMWERARFLTIQQHKETKCGYIQGADKMNLSKLTDDEIKYLDEGTYYDIKIKDMTAGGLSSWIDISTIKDVSRPKNTIVVHCLAGAGRTGSVLLYLLMRDTGNILNAMEKQRYITEIKDKLAMPHFGLNNIAEVVGVLRAYFVNNSDNVKFATKELFKIGSRIMDEGTEQMLRDKGVDEDKIKTIKEQGIDTDIYEYLMSKIDKTELSELDARQNESQASSSLLRQRLNRIFFFLAKEFKVSRFYTYGRPISQVLMLPNDEFSNPVLRVVSDWDNYNRDDVRKWLN